MPAKFLKDGSTQVASPLTHIINLSLYSGVIPTDLKCARVVPPHKKGNKTDVGNYRSISILSVVSKILVNVVYNQIENYLNENSLLYDFQSGFRSGFSTDTSLTYLNDLIRS